MSEHSWSIEWNAKTTATIPMSEGSVREASVIQLDGTWFMYADVVPWDNPYHPNTYNTGIHVFSSKNGVQWQHGRQVLRGKPGSWDAGGVASPGAVAYQGKVWLFYSGRQLENGKGHRHIGLAVAESPLGPFSPLLGPVISGSGAKDDPCPVVSPDGKAVRLYYRKADGIYSIQCASAEVAEGPWTHWGPVIEAKGDLRATESTEAKVIGQTTLLAVMEQYHTQGKGIRTILYASSDGKAFTPCHLPWFEEKVDITVGSPMGSHLSLHQTEAGEIIRFGVTRRLDSAGHYSRCLFDIHNFWLQSAPPQP